MLVWIRKNTWNKWIGPADLFSLEQRILHAILLILAPVIFLSAVFDLLIGLTGMSAYLLITFICQIIAVYLSRVKRKTQWGVILFAFNGYGFLIVNYFLNSGIQGPTILLFILEFMAVLVVSSLLLNRFWFFLHLTFAIGLMWLEYRNPQLITFSYESRSLYFIDMGFSYFCSILLIYGIVTYIKFNYWRERKLANERADINAQQKEQLEKLHAEKDLLFSIIGHDIRSPLSLIKGYLSMMEADITLSAEDAAALRKQLNESVDGTLQMLENLLEWSSLEYRQQEKLESLDPATVMTDVLVLLEKQAAHKHINIERQQEGARVNILASRRILELVFRNIVHNAIKFTPAGGQIQIREEIIGQAYSISIRDNGIGMSEEQLNGLFTFRAKHSYGTAREKGTGLGLLLSKELLHAIGGSIEASGHPGKGSCFVIRFHLQRHQ